jgi:hypothetical protein
VLLRMQVKPEDATWFHCFQIAELYLCTMCLKRRNQQQRRKVYHTRVTHRGAVHELDIGAHTRLPAGDGLP